MIRNCMWNLLLWLLGYLMKDEMCDTCKEEKVDIVNMYKDKEGWYRIGSLCKGCWMEYVE
jgi:hypothetical protein